jgi:hypothetical protein
LSGGAGSCQITETAPADYSFTATYGGDTNDAGSTTAGDVTVGQDTTTTTIVDTTANVVVGQPIIVDVSVSANSPGIGTPTGTVTVSDGGTQTCTTADLIGGAGSCAITELTANSYSFTGTYNGDTNDAASTTGSGTEVTVSQDATTTSIVDTTANPVVGQPITVEVSVSANSPGSGTPTGTVTVSDGASHTCPAVLSDGSGSCAITETVAADYTFTATYKGDVDDVSSSTAAGTDVTVGQDDTSTVITNTTSSFVVGQPITIDVSVSANSPGSGTPTGTVTVSDGGTQTCPATLSGGVGSCQVTETTAGAYTFSAAYGGDSNYVSSSTENGMAVTVGGDATTTDITTTTPSEPVVGQPITVGVNVGVVPPGSGTPAGTVTVSDGAQTCTTAALVDGAGSCQITAGEAAPGDYSFTATYSGDLNDASSNTSSATPVTVGEDATTTDITSTTVTPVVGQPFTVDVSVSANSPGNGTPTGQVSVSDGTTQGICAVTLGAGTGSCQITAGEATPGDHTFTAFYNGDSADFTSSTSTTVDVAKATTTTTLQLSNPTVTFGDEQTETLSATVAPEFAGTPGGTVTVTESAATLCTITLVAGSGSCSLSASRLAGDAYAVEASYNVNADFAVSSSASQTLTVSAAASATVLALSVPRVTYGDEESERASVTVSPEFAGTPGGTVTVAESSTVLCTITLSTAAGSCTLSATRLGAGGYNLVATYSDTADSDFGSSASASQSLAVSKESSTTVLKLSAPKVTYGDEEAEHLSFTVTPQFAGTTATGTVTVTRSTFQLCSISLSSEKGSCTLSATHFGADVYDLVATYSGTANIGTSSSTQKLTVSRASSRTALRLARTTVTYGDEQAEHLSVTVSPEFAGIPIGTVTVERSTTKLCSIKLSASGKGSCTLSATRFGAGGYDVVATYGGNADFGSSASAREALKVQKATSRTSLRVATNRVSYGAESGERLSFTVSPEFAGPTPTGTVTVTASGSRLCSVSLSSGEGSCTLSNTRLGAGTYGIVATYGGNSNFDAAGSGAQDVTIAKATSRTSLEMSTSRVSYGNEHVERLSVTVTPEFAGATPAGTVRVGDGSSTLCVITLSSGSGSCTLSSARLGAGSYRLVANYNGGFDFDASGSAHVTLSVAKATSTSSLKLSSSKIVDGNEQVEHLSVVVSPQFGGVTATGTVRVTDSSSTLCVITLSSGRGSCTLSHSQLGPGTYFLAGTYGGSSDFDASASAAEMLKVTFSLSVG